MKTLFNMYYKLIKAPLLGAWIPFTILIYIIVFLFINEQKISDIIMIYVLIGYCGLLVTILSVTTLIYKETTNNNEIERMLKSLPVKKRDIVKCKEYLPIIIFGSFTFINTIICLIIFNIKRINIRIDFVVFWILLWFILTYLLSMTNLYIGLITTNSKTLNTCRIFSYIIFMLGGPAFNYIEKFKYNYSLWEFNIILIILCVFIFLINKYIGDIVLEKYKKLEV